MGVIIKILFIFLCLFLFVRFIYYRFINTYIIKSYFKKLSVMVCGKRGTGKDTLFSYVAYKKNNNSNIKINDHTNVINLDDICIPNLTRQQLVKGNNGFAKFSDYSHFDNISFISDSGIYYPSFDDSILKKEYPSFATSIAIWRHLYNSGLHFNCQVNTRLWKILREQIEDTIMCLECKRGLLYTKLKLRYYESPRDAELCLKPIKIGFFRKGNPDYNIELSKRWEIKDYTLFIPNRMITHNSRAFKDIIFKKGEYDEFI